MFCDSKGWVWVRQSLRRQRWGEVDFFLLCCFLSMVLLRRSVEIILVVNIFQRYKSFPDLICACYSRYSLQGFFYFYLFLRLRQPRNYLWRAREFVQSDHGRGWDPSLLPYRLSRGGVGVPPGSLERDHIQRGSWRTPCRQLPWGCRF